MLHNAASVELKDICDRLRCTSLRILSEVNPSRIVIDPSVEDGEVGDGGQACEGVDGLIQRSWRCCWGMLNPACAEVIQECSLDVLGIVKLLNEFIEDGDLLSRGCWARRAVARSRSYGQERQKDVELHDGEIETIVPADDCSVPASI